MQVSTTTTVSFTKTEAAEVLLKESGIELEDDQRVWIQHRTEPLERYVLLITTKDEVE